ncbi:hypothetical protein P5V15_000795 [Pogonomyrmex californicus]
MAGCKITLLLLFLTITSMTVANNSTSKIENTAIESKFIHHHWIHNLLGIYETPKTSTDSNQPMTTDKDSENGSSNNTMTKEIPKNFADLNKSMDI